MSSGFAEHAAPFSPARFHFPGWAGLKGARRWTKADDASTRPEGARAARLPSPAPRGFLAVLRLIRSSLYRLRGFLLFIPIHLVITLTNHHLTEAITLISVYLQESAERGMAEQPDDSQPPTTATEATDKQAAQTQPDQSEPEHLSGDGSYNRRRFMKAGGAVGVLAAVGTAFLYAGSSEPATATPLPNGVPETAEFAAHGEADELLADQSFQDAIDEQLQEQGVELATLLDTVDATTGIDPRSVGTVAGFGTVADGGSGAVIIETDSSSGTVHEALDSSGLLGDVAEREGQELYEITGPGSLWLGDLGGGEFAVGAREAIGDILAVRAGTAAGISSDLGNAVTEPTGGVVQFGAVIPDEPFEALGLPAVGDQFVDFGNLDYAYGSVNDGEVLLTIETTSSSTASDLASMLGALALLVEDNADRLGLPDRIETPLVEILGGMEAEADGDVVEATLPGGFRLIAVVGAFLLGASQFAGSQ